jgi:5-methylthioribose kinase
MIIINDELNLARFEVATGTINRETAPDLSTLLDNKKRVSHERKLVRTSQTNKK